ncbi:MAG: DNA polymerase III subunit alpha, partial [Pseudomonadota bacterium]
ICKMNFAGYFLIVSDFIQWAKANNITVGPGRGSGSGSIIAWSISITNINPLKFNLIFERFLNPERISMPDFDIDFCQARRHEVIEYIKNKYGQDNVSQIITFGMLKPKAALKDISRVYNLPFHIANYLSNLIPFNQVKPPTLSECIMDVKELAQAYQGNGLYNNQDFNSIIKLIIEEALLLENIHRHVSIHAAGIVISPTPLIETIALYKNEDSDMNIIQYSMQYTEMIGLVKFDILGLQNLTVISKCLEHIKNNSNITLDLDTLSDQHTKVFDLLSSGNTRGIFQFESSGIQQEITKFQPKSIFDIMALTSLYRPGPIENLPKYIARKFNKEKIEYLHPNAEELLKETYGIIIYQEQVLSLAKQLAGYSLGSADILRKAMGKKKPIEMEKQRAIFIEGCIKNNIDKDKANEIFKYIATFAGYGFNRAHAATYALIAYYTAYLKCFHLQEFLISAMNLEINDKDRICLFCHDMKKNNIQIAKLSINNIELYFTIQSKNIISYSLLAIRGIPINSAKHIITERETNGIYSSLEDFITRCKKHINKKSLESLILSGCLDEFNYTRKALFNSIEHILSYINHIDNINNSIQLSLFPNINNLKIENIKEFSTEELLKYEFNFLQTFITQHPIDIYKQYLSQYQIKTSQEAYHIYKNSTHITYQNKEKIFIIGFIEYRINKISKGRQFSWFRLSDHLGEIYVSLISSEVNQKYNELLQEKQSVILECEIYNERIFITQAFPVMRLVNKILQEMHLYIPDEQVLTNIFNLIQDKEIKSSINKNNIVDHNNGITQNSSYTTVYLYLKIYNKFVSKITLNNKFALTLYDYEQLSKYKYK